jgi:predicted anti-sigma-YlaC factor YlaD
MNACSLCRRRLSLFIDRRLHAADHSMMEAHLASCGDCRDRWSAQVALGSLFQTERTKFVRRSPALSPFFETRFWARVEDDRRPPARWRRFWAPLTAGGLALLLTWFIPHPRSTKVPAMESQAGSLFGLSSQLAADPASADALRHKSEEVLNSFL